MLLVFVVDASVTLWRRAHPTDRRRAVIVGGSIAFFVLVAAGHSALLEAGLIQSPYLIGFSFLPIVAAMGYELGSDVLQARQLARQLQVSEAEARETEQQMALAASAAELAMWMWDIPRDEIWTTDKGRALFGFAESENLNLERFLDALHPEDRDRVREVVKEALNGTGENESEFRIVLPTGQTRWIATRGRVEFEGSKPVRMRGVSLDITQRRQAELEAALQRKELAHLSRVTLLGELAASLVHELNQPLTAILSNAQAAQRTLARGLADLGELEEILLDIVAEDKRAGEVIRRLRALLKKGEVQFEPLDVNELVETALKLVRSDLANQNVAVFTGLAQRLPAVNGDGVQLQQVLLNLVLNACDAMAEVEAIERKLLLRTEYLDSGEVKVSVRDQGSGIPREKLECIFEPFFTTKTEGMGMGLAICRTIISAHGGKLWATNNPDHGATVQFTLPQAR